MKLVDTSAWVHQLRAKGDLRVRERVEALLRSGEAAWCPMVRIELWAGVRNERERTALRAFEEVLPDLPIAEGVWRVARDLASRARKGGLSVPATDLVIFACAHAHAVEIEHADAHFEMLAAL